MTRLSAAARRGFTLIELIVVIVIIGILAAVAAVSYNSFIGNAQGSSAESVAAQAAKSFQANAAFTQKDYVDVADIALAAPSSTGWTSDFVGQADKIGYDKASQILTIESGDFTCTVDFSSATLGGSPALNADKKVATCV